MYEAILAPVNESETAGTGIDEALRIATFTGGTVHGLHVFDTGEYETVTASDFSTSEGNQADRNEQPSTAVESRAEDMEVSVETATTQGVPHKEILTYADEQDIDLIVMGTHGRTGLDHFLKGSVTERVIREATVPVLVVRP